MFADAVLFCVVAGVFFVGVPTAICGIVVALIFPRKNQMRTCPVDNRQCYRCCGIPCQDQPPKDAEARKERP